MFEVTVIHIGINNIVSNKNPLNTDHMLENVKNIARKCKRYGIQKVLISGVNNHKSFQDFIEEVDKLIKNMGNIEGYF